MPSQITSFQNHPSIIIWSVGNEMNEQHHEDFPGQGGAITRRLVEICKNLESKYQTEIMPSGAGTDAAAVEISREGVPTVLVSVPNRYMHTPVEVVQPKDVDRTARLLAQFIAGLDEVFIDELIPA